METNELLFNIGALIFNIILIAIVLYGGFSVLFDKKLSFVEKAIIIILSLLTLVIILPLILDIFNKILTS